MTDSNRVFAWHMSPTIRPLTPMEVDNVNGADGVITIGADMCSTYTQPGVSPDDPGVWDELDV